jgi:hypothetical protein
LSDRLCDNLIALEGYFSIEPLGGFKEAANTRRVSASDCGPIVMLMLKLREITS